MAENLSSAFEIYSCCLESLFITCTTEDCYCSVSWTDWIEWMQFSISIYLPFIWSIGVMTHWIWNLSIQK